MKLALLDWIPDFCKCCVWEKVLYPTSLSDFFRGRKTLNMCLWVLSDNCVGTIWIIFGYYLNNLWVLSEYCVGIIWILCGYYLNNLWVLSEYCCIIWIIFGYYLNNLWVLSEYCVGIIWIIFGCCLNNLWVLSEYCVTAVLLLITSCWHFLLFISFFFAVNYNSITISADKM